MATANWSEWRKPQRKERLDLYLLFGCTTYGADTTCCSIHPGAEPGTVGLMKEGDRACCAVCHATGVEDHPDLKVTPEDREFLKNYNPDDGFKPAKAGPPPRKPKSGKKTRKQLRADAAREIPMDPDAIQRLVDSGHATLPSKQRMDRP